MSAVIDDLALDALPALMDATALVDPTTLALVNGRLDLDPLLEAGPQVVAADAAVRSAATRLGEIEPTELLPAVANPLADLSTQLDEVAITTATAARAVQLLPRMMGADGPRDYLLLVQNNAELRATGGIPGAIILLRADDGAVEVVEQRTGGSLGDLAEPALPLTAEELSIFGEDLGADMRDVTFTPDFPRSGQLARAIWSQQVGGEVDGVLSIDPGTLALVLGATGPVTLPTGQELTANNAVQVLLNTVYLELADPADQDEFFASTATTVFSAVASGQGEPAATVDALAEAARRGRLLVWSAHDDEQSLLADTVLSGALIGVDGDSPVTGVYLNDGSAAKMGFYLRTDVTAETTECREDGSQSITVTVTLTSAAPADAASLPPYLTGSGRVIPLGEIRTNVLLYTPLGGAVEDVDISISPPGVSSQTHDRLGVVGRTIQLKPGEEGILTYHLTSGPGQSGQAILRVTPGVQGTNELIGSTGCP